MSDCFRWFVLLGLVAVLGIEAGLWLQANEIADGHQNEYLHVGNALDLWGAWIDRDWWHLNYYGAANYWPPGFYVAPWPAFAVLGPTHVAMVLTNLGHLALLLWSTLRLGEELGGRRSGLMAAALVVLYPSVFGNLVRYEPNIALTAWVTFAALCALRSNELRETRWSIGFGLACSVGLMMDRLSFGFFLLWPVLLALRHRSAWRGVLMATGIVLVLTGWWHWNFLELHLDEVISQQGVGEIDSTGSLTQPTASAPLLYYPLILLDSQAGLGPGLAGLVALFMARRRALVPLAVVLGSTAVFTLITKKQAYYTLPMLGCLAALTADTLRGRKGLTIFVLLAILGVDQHAARMWDKGVLPDALSKPLLPKAWVEPRHPQALPPRGLALPIEAIADASADVGQTVVFSEDYTWFEGFAVLNLRERLWPRQVRGLIGDPTGTYEWFQDADTFVYVSLDRSGDTWPETSRMEAALLQHNYTLEDLPPVIDIVEEDRLNWRLVGSWDLEEGGRVSVWGRH